MESDIAAGLDDLDRRLTHLKGLLEWQRLYDQEGHLAANGFWHEDSTPQEIAVAYGTFISLALDLQTMLDTVPLEAPLAVQRQWQSCLQVLLQDCHDLAIPERYLNR